MNCQKPTKDYKNMIFLNFSTLHRHTSQLPPHHPTFWLPYSCKLAHTLAHIAARCDHTAHAAISAITHAKSCFLHAKFMHMLHKAIQGETHGSTPTAAADAAAMSTCNTQIIRTQQARRAHAGKQARDLPSACEASHAVECGPSSQAFEERTPARN